MGLARREAERRCADHVHAESGQSHLAGPLSHLRQRRLGACLLPEIQQPPSRIPRRLVEHSELGRNQQALRRLQGRQRSPRTSHGPPLACVGADTFVRPATLSEAKGSVPFVGAFPLRGNKKALANARAFANFAIVPKPPTARTAPDSAQTHSCIPASRMNTSGRHTAPDAARCCHRLSFHKPDQSSLVYSLRILNLTGDSQQISPDFRSGNSCSLQFLCAPPCALW